MANPRSPVSTAALLLKSSGKGKRTGEPDYEQRATLMERRELGAKSQSEAKKKEQRQQLPSNLAVKAK
jgi:hypothetical protein